MKRNVSKSILVILKPYSDRVGRLGFQRQERRGRRGFQMIRGGEPEGERSPRAPKNHNRTRGRNSDVREARFDAPAGSCRSRPGRSRQPDRIYDRRARRRAAAEAHLGAAGARRLGHRPAGRLQGFLRHGRLGVSADRQSELLRREPRRTSQQRDRREAGHYPHTAREPRAAAGVRARHRRGHHDGHHQPGSPGGSEAAGARHHRPERVRGRHRERLPGRRLRREDASARRLA